jgi:acetyl esterase/lipase
VRYAAARALLLSGLVLPVSAATIERDVPYVPGGGHKQQLDLYLPDARNFPTILLIHGGSLESGDRKEAPFPQVAAAFQNAGVACAIMSYRLFSEAPWPAQPQDAAAAFAWLKKYIGIRGGDAGRIFVMGHSSGAHLAALIASDPRFLKAHGLSTKDVAGAIPIGVILFDKETVDAIEQAAPEKREKAFQSDPYLKMFGSLEGFRNAWPSSHISPHLPPFLILIAETEQEQPPILARATEFAAAARKFGVRVEIEILKGRRHMTTMEKMPEPGDPALRRILQFVSTAGRS